MKFFKVFICLFLLFLITGCNSKVSLDAKYYTSSSIIEIDNNQLQSLIVDKDSFAVFIYQSNCATSSKFETILNDFISMYKMNFYKVQFSSIKDTDLGKKIKYYPSFVIYEKGKIVDYLDASSNEDISKYNDLNEFTNWLSGKVKLGERLQNNNESSDYEENPTEDIKIELDNVSYDENKVNIYMFYGEGCPHCESQMMFLDSIEEEYGDYFTLYKFEVWNSNYNKNVMNQFANKMGDKPQGVPYTIIGNKSFNGYGEQYNQKIIDAIMSQYKNSYDVYFSK